MSITITPANNITITLGAQGPAGQDGEDGDITSATATDIDGILKGDGATISAAVAGVDYLESASIPDELTDLDTTVTGAQLNSLKTKVDGIESSATADQTGAEIKALYEAESDTNAFTDSDHSKLDGIEAGADVTNTANVTAAGALMDSEVTNLAEVKAFDPTDYATAAQGATADTAIQPADISGLTGGTTGQIATKASGDDYDLTWADDLTVPGLLTADHIHGNIAGTLYIHVKNTSGGTLAGGRSIRPGKNAGDCAFGGGTARQRRGRRRNRWRDPHIRHRHTRVCAQRRAICWHRCAYRYQAHGRRSPARSDRSTTAICDRRACDQLPGTAIT